MNKSPVVLLLLCFMLATGSLVSAGLPVTVPDHQWRPLAKHTDDRLQAALALSLRNDPRLQQLVKSKKLAIALVDLGEPATPRYASVNGSRMMYAASLPKIAILFAAFERIERGEMTLDEEIEKDLNDMIRVSSNSAATRMIDRLGGLQEINLVLSNPRYGFYSSKRGGGLWVGKRYAKKGKRLPDPVKGLSHGATVHQVARLYYQLATGRLLSESASRQMLEILADPGLNHKFVKPLSQRAPDARLYRKSGTWKQWHSDSILVWGADWHRYILVGMVESPSGGEILQQLVSIAEQVLQAPPQKPDEAEE